ncbi:hypothetical protein SCH01S_51_01280 [Sphingomonas changbaiensis NBRC 104936]|uniref:Uncharacterized protein n=1 Tax=Sphingomonas changbaiensis NBRC 104936 TaxID=1219043 RepID=A0A0E9MUH3_9SPHN|nr:hypothetical protein [Sphingomonas changbaiensis]GAO40795.1 hypothetical protein SCH01S_51_01280 [Sphingomonas changbaiensis NBRC 104936]
MFDWFKRKTRPLEAESRWAIAIDGERISVRDNVGETKTVAKSDLSAVAVETNDSGPWGADVWWLLFDCSDRLACAFPQGATGEKAVIDYIMRLPAFDYEAMIKAMASTENAVFPVWRRAP